MKALLYFYGGMVALGFALPRAQAEIQYVIHISSDGMRGDLVKALIANSPTTYPNLKKIVDEGAATFNARCDFDYSETLQNHSTMITGRPVLDPADSPGFAHNYFINSYSGTTTTGDSLHKVGVAPYSYNVSTFDMVHDRGLSTALYAGKIRFNLFLHSYNATKGRADTIAPDNGKNKISFASVPTMGDLTNTTQMLSVNNQVVTRITNGTLANYTFLHYIDSDSGNTVGGHYVDWGSTNWEAGVAGVDGYLGSIFAALAANSTYANKVAIVLTADHGGGGGGGTFFIGASKNHGDASSVLNYTIPFMTWGPGIPGGVDAHQLFKNRSDPDASRPNTSASTIQPLRNADTGNFAMTLLGIPPIEGSYYKPEPSATPSVTETPTSWVITWPLYLTKYKLQSTTNLAAPGSWLNDGGTPVEAATTYSRTVAKAPGEPRRYWRLQAPQ